MKFKVGDKVRVVKVRKSHKKSYIGREYEITCINPNIFFRDEEHYSIGQSYIVFPDELELVTENKIVITVNGNETVATLYNDSEVVKKASAVCSPSDTFDFTTGAKLAFERLMGEQKKEDTFVPHLMWDGEHLGVIGEPTNYKDNKGISLYIGDEVEVHYNGKRFGNSVVVKDTSGAFVMGCKVDCFPEHGIIRDFTILKKRSYKEIKHSNNRFGIKYITKREG